MLKIISDALLLQLDLRIMEEHRSLGRQILYDASQAMTAALTVEQIADATANACMRLVPMTALRIFWTASDGTLNLALNRGAIPSETIGNVTTNAVTTLPIQSATQELLGLLEISHSESDSYFVKNRTELSTLTSQMAVAFQKARLFSDLTAERQRLDRTVDELRRMARLRDEFLATVSHELRTPLNAIIGWSQLLVDEEVTESDRADGIDAIHRNAIAQVRIVEDLLDTSRIITGKLSLEPKLQDVRRILDAALSTVKPSAAAKSIVLEAKVPEGSLMLAVDAGRLQQIFWNLLSNAIKFTPQGGRIELVVGVSATDIQFEIKDSGKGIKKDFLPYVFDRFAQEDGSTTRRFGGLGLGLAIVRHLAEMHGGQVSVKSRGEGFGASFIVSLPKPQVDLSSAPLTPEPTLKDLKPLEGIRVVVVDDEVDARHLLMRMLTIAGANVQVAANSPDALGLVEKWQPDLVIADICMPEEDGYALLERIRALPDEAGGKTPAFAVTAFHESSDKVRALKAGFQRHFEKPLNQQVFIESLKEWVAVH
jgi:signal transduction histidine kinase/CheY-like chemotaxis protein